MDVILAKVQEVNLVPHFHSIACPLPQRLELHYPRKNQKHNDADDGQVEDHDFEEKDLYQLVEVHGSVFLICGWLQCVLHDNLRIGYGCKVQKHFQHQKNFLVVLNIVVHCFGTTVLLQLVVFIFLTVLKGEFVQFILWHGTSLTIFQHIWWQKVVLCMAI